VQGVPKALKVQMHLKRVKKVPRNRQRSHQPDQQKSRKIIALKKYRHKAKARKGQPADESLNKNKPLLKNSSPLVRSQVEFNRQ